MKKAAEKDFESALELNPSDPQIYYFRGRLYKNWSKLNPMYELAHKDFD